MIYDVHSEIRDDDVTFWVFRSVEDIFRSEEIDKDSKLKDNGNPT